MAEGEFILYRTRDGLTEIQLRSVDGTVWLTQAEMAVLFQITPQAVTQSIASIYDEGELIEAATCKELLQVRSESGREVRRRLKTYRLDVILAVGYRVRSPRGTQFRQWATTVLQDYLRKGFVMNDERLKEPAAFDYFDELLERIRDIRASEKRFYQKVRDVFARTSADYDPKAADARVFFQTVQNKMLYAVTGSTAAELVLRRADAGLPNMGLTGWAGERVRKADAVVAKNYLLEAEIVELNRLVTMFLDFAEDRAARRQATTMSEWVAQADRFLVFNERAVLGNAGRVSNAQMEAAVADTYLAFDSARRRQEALDADADDALDALSRIEDATQGRRRDDS